MAELPKPEELASALASFPPKLSVLVKPLTVPEDLFESTIRSAAGVELPAGPHKMLVELMQSFEVSLPTVTRLPGLVPPGGGGGSPQVEEEEKPRTTFVFK
jgi:hypothetical protein